MILCKSQEERPSKAKKNTQDAHVAFPPTPSSLYRPTPARIAVLVCSTIILHFIAIEALEDSASKGPFMVFLARGAA